MKNFSVGDTVRHSKWAHLSTHKVEAVSSDGKSLWLRDEDGILTTRENSGLWGKVEPFFQEGKHYISDATGRTYKVDYIGTDSRGGKYAILNGINTPNILVQRQYNFENFEEN